MEVQLLDPHDAVGGRERAVDVAPVEAPFPDEVAAGVVVHDRRVGVARAPGVDVDAERLVLDLDELGGVPGEVAGRSHDGDDGLAHVPGLPDRHAVVLDLVGRGAGAGIRVGQLGHLVADERAVHAVQRLRLRHVDADDAGVRVGRADEVDVAGAVPATIVEVHALPVHEALVFLARDAPAREPLLRPRLEWLGRDGAHAGSPSLAARTARTMFT